MVQDAHHLRAVERGAGGQGVQLAHVQVRAREQSLGLQALAGDVEHGVGGVHAREAPARHVEAGVGHQLRARAQSHEEQRRRVLAVELGGQRADAELVHRLGAGEVDGRLGVVVGGAVGAKARHDVVGGGGGVFVSHDVSSESRSRLRECVLARVNGRAGIQAGLAEAQVRPTAAIQVSEGGGAFRFARGSPMVNVSRAYHCGQACWRARAR